MSFIPARKAVYPSLGRSKGKRIEVPKTTFRGWKSSFCISESLSRSSPKQRAAHQESNLHKFMSCPLRGMMPSTIPWPLADLRGFWHILAFWINTAQKCDSKNNSCGSSSCISRARSKAKHVKSQKQLFGARKDNFQSRTV